MRLSWATVGFAVMACVALSVPAYSDAHGAATVHAPQSTAKPVMTGKPSTTKPSSTTKPVQTTKHSTVAGTTSTSTTSTRLNPIAAKISTHQQLRARVTSLLPPNTTLNQASKGFKNQGQFIAALHVSRNLDIPFADLKKDMIERHMSLGQSIHDLKHSANATTEAHTGEREADEDMHSSTRHHEAEHHHMEHLTIAQRITSNPQLLARVQALLPAGTTLSRAARGFRSESEFLAALHASKDLGIPFTQMKSEMTGSDRDTLFRAIQELKPAADAATAAKTAQAEAVADIRATTTHTTQTTH